MIDADGDEAVKENPAEPRGGEALDPFGYFAIAAAFLVIILLDLRDGLRVAGSHVLLVVLGVGFGIFGFVRNRRSANSHGSRQGRSNAR
ncbi:MAG TPA: hypothetical protein VFR81_21145 [Longimicrobium sp.]|nr:hypothetical protein [Longimicrobium sp.]